METHIKPGMDLTIRKSVVTRDWQEPNPIFPLGAMVPVSLVQCSWQLSISTMNNKNLLYFAKEKNSGAGGIDPLNRKDSPETGKK